MKSTTSKQPGKQPIRNRTALRGLLYQHRPNRPLPFLLGWRESGKTRWKSFATGKEREDAAESLSEKSDFFGKEVLNFDPREWRTWLAFKAKIGDADPLQVAHEWLVGRGGTTESITVTKAVTKYLAHRHDGGNLSKDTHRHFKKHLEDRFAATHGLMKLHEVTADTIRDWLKSLRKKDGKMMEPVTLRHHRKDLNTFLDWCVADGFIQRNPCASVAVPQVPESDVKLLTVEEIRQLFTLNKGKRVLGRLALEAFGFMRASSAGRVQKDDIKFEAKGIRMPGAQHKSGKARFRQGHPENLWAWLKQAPDECWTMKWWEYRNEKRIAFGVANLGDSENRLRKTCLSAHLAWLKNQPLTSYLAQHRHTSTTEIYLGVMDEKDAEAYFKIMP